MLSFVSVIIPVLNVRAFWEEALDNVVHQTYKTLDIIKVNDGSMDGSTEICDEYTAKDEHINVIRQQNKGLNGARDVVIDIMKGDYVSNN